MSLQWIFAAYILYAEVGIVLLLSIPFIPNTFWNSVFKLKIFSWLGHVGQHAFIVIAGILSLLFLDSIREIQKYDKLADEMDHTAGIITHDPHTNKFRAQRNFYISLFAFVFWVVLKRLIDVIALAARLEYTKGALEKQAVNASKMAEKIMDDQDRKEKENEENDNGKIELKKELEEIKIKLASARSEAVTAVKDLEVMKKQAKATNAEYDRLMGELEKYQNNEKNNCDGDGEGKKDE